MNSERSKSLITENLLIAWDVLRSHKLRSSLIILGVCIGVAALMGMVSILAGLGEKITRDINRSERTVLMLLKFDFFVGGFDEAMLHRKDITEDDARALREQCKTIQYVTYLAHEEGPPRFTLKAGNEKSRMIQVVGTQPSLFNVWSLDLENGRMFSDEEVLHREKVVVLGYSPRRDLFPSTDPIGKKVRIENDE